MCGTVKAYITYTVTESVNPLENPPLLTVPSSSLCKWNTYGAFISVLGCRKSSLRRLHPWIARETCSAVRISFCIAEMGEYTFVDSWL